MNYNQIDKLSKEYIQKKIKEFLQEDMPKGDITTDNIYKNEQIEAQIIATEEFVFCGEKIVKNIFTKECKIISIQKEGKKIKEKEIIAKIHGPAKEILKKERVMLNLIQRLSAISTNTHKVVVKAKPYKVKILDLNKFI